LNFLRNGFARLCGFAQNFLYGRAHGYSPFKIDNILFLYSGFL
jgi:hypothetical protein